MKWLVMLGIISFIYLLWQTNLYLKVQIKHDDGTNLLQGRIYIWRGLLGYSFYWPPNANSSSPSYHFPSSKFKQFIHNKFLKKDTQTSNLTAKLTQLSVYKHILTQFITKIRLDRFENRIYFGLDDAAATATISGVLWAIHGMINPVLMTAMSAGRRPISIIRPIFGKQLIYLDSQCILRVQLGNIITAIYKAVKLGGINYGRTSNTRSDENNHGKH